MAKAQTIELKAGDVLGGKYRIERVIGQGGMGVVAAARHTELQQRVAIKVLRERFAKEHDLVERFMREARAAARLRSEHSVRVIDVGTRSSGAPYIVMELLEGEDLGAIVERAPLSIADAVDFLLQACEAIAEAHALGIVHRDLKPRNLFLTTKLHGKALVKVLDFGLAKRVDMQDKKLTATAAVMGSPQYMSPEQMRGARDLDVRTDIWSLGVCLYELVSSHVPFDAAAVPVLCAMVLKDAPVPLPTYRSDVPPALWSVIEQCLRKDPAERFSSVSDLAQALEPFAPAHARGAATRIAAVLFAVPDQAADGPVGLASGPEHVADLRDTRIAATFDSEPRVGEGRSVLWVIAGVALFTILSVLGGVFLVRWLRHPPPAAAISPREAEVFEAGLVPGASAKAVGSAPSAMPAIAQPPKPLKKPPLGPDQRF